MGSYLSEPITEKVSTDESNDRLNCGASSMQGWRVSQEDAHNCLLDFDTNTSFFSVFDGHGGHEVALYCSQKLPEFLKALEAYKEGNLEKALIDTFLGFDATIATREVVAILKDLAKDKEAEESDEEVEDNVDNLYEEAAMPIDQVIEKYKSNLLNPIVKNVKAGEKLPVSPYLISKKDHNAGSSGTDVVTSSDSSEATNGGKVTEEKETDSPDSSGDKISTTTEEVTEHQNGEVNKEDEAVKSEDVTSSSTPTENGEAVKKGKGKALMKTKGAKPLNLKSSRPKRTVQQMYAKLLDYEDSEESEDEEDKTFEGPKDESSEEDAKLEGEDSSEDDDDDEEEEEDEDGEEEDQADHEFAKNMREEPGSDSGCTAVVAVLKDNSLYVANAGDSRCIVCRNGQAIEMSFDHKPEDEPERERVVKAGGKVTVDGRVNGGLNLSRAIGDHAYKQNKELSDREQMITALPDIRTLTINPSEDEFMVLACDGIWNFMSSQEVVDFVRPSIKEGKKLSKICEEMFDHCLAPNTMGDGTGCDNMTAIIVQFKSTILKRSASPVEEHSDNKRAKTEAKPKEAATA